MNLLNYVDRWVPSAVKEDFKRELQLTDAQTSYPLTGLVIVYMICSPIFGSLSDRWPRKWVIVVGVGLWSLATGAAYFAVGFWSFLITRALVGVGEAAYATLAPALLSDFFAPARRNRILTGFYVAIPVGSALGFALGGIIGQHYGWRVAFLACGLPGILVALLALRIKEPARGTFDDDKNTVPPSWKEALRQLSQNREYVLAVLGYVFVTFASGALGDWFPAFLTRLRGMDAAEAGTLTGVAAVVGGLGGTIAGGVFAEKLKGRTRNPFLAVSGVAMLVAAALCCVGIVAESKAAIITLIVVTQFFMWFYNGPINTLLVNCVSSALRTRAFSLSILLIHLLGDALSPSIVGMISDATADAAHPGGNLLLAISIVPVMLLLGAAVWIYAWRTLPEKT